MKQQDIHTLLSKVASNDKEAVVAFVRILAAQEHKSGKLDASATLLGYADRIERSRSLVARELTLLSNIHRRACLDACELRPATRSLDDAVLPDAIRADIERVILEYSKSELLSARGLPVPLRLLFSGASGTGKTLCAEIIAKHLGKPFYVVNIARILDSHLGQSLHHLEGLFAAIEQEDVVFLFDEIEALAVDRGNAHDVGEMRRIASSLLVELDGINSPSLIIGATNRPDLMDAAFRRRFDFVIHFPESTLDANLSLTEKVALKYRFSFVRDSASASLKDVLSKCSPHEVERLVIRAAKHAVISGAESLDLDREVGVTAAAINVFSR